MFKQKNENKYQEIVGFLFSKLNESFSNIDERINVMNMLVLCMQVIDDELFKTQFIDFIVHNVAFCKKNIKRIHNQRLIINVINSNNIYRDMIISNYQDIAIFECIVAFCDLNDEMDAYRYRFQHFYNYNFYSQIYFSNNKIDKIFENFESIDIVVIGRKAGANTKEIGRIQAKYKKYIALKPELKKELKRLLI